MPFALLLNDRRVTIPTSWPDVTLGQYLNYLAQPLQNKLSFLECNNILSFQELASIEEIFVENFLSPAFAFMDSPPEPGPMPAHCHGLAVPSDLGDCSYGRKVDATALISEHQQNPLLAAADLLAIYLMPDPYAYDLKDVFVEAMRELPVTEALPIFLYLLDALMALDTQLGAQLKRIPYREEELKAGIKELEIWGPYAIADNLSGGDLLRHGAIFDLSVHKVHTFLRYSNHRAYIRHRIEEEQRKEANKTTKARK